MRQIKKPNREDLIEPVDAPEPEPQNAEKKEPASVAFRSERKYALTGEKASPIINRYTIAAMAAGAIPMPGADVVAVTAIQADLVEELAREYGLKIPHKQGKRVALILTGAMTVAVGARAVFSALKAVPFVGSTIGGGASAIASAVTTYTIGRVLADHFEKGGTLHDTMIGDLTAKAKALTLSALHDAGSEK